MEALEIQSEISCEINGRRSIHPGAHRAWKLIRSLVGAAVSGGIDYRQGMFTAKGCYVKRAFAPPMLCEGRISVLKRCHGLRRCRYRGLRGMERWVGLGVIANNLRVLGRAGPAQADLPPAALTRIYTDTAREFLGLDDARG